MFDDVKKLARDNHSKLYDMAELVINDNSSLSKFIYSMIDGYKLQCDNLYKEILDLEAMVGAIVDSHEDKVVEHLQKIQEKLTNIKSIIDSVK